LALAARLPTMSYGPNLTNLFRGAAEFVGKILRRVKPGDILVMQSSKFKLVGRFHGSNHMPTKIGLLRCSCGMLTRELWWQPIG
jgi:hypothetical protein